MWESSFFLTTRGKVLLLLKKSSPCTVAYLSQQLGLTRNAIRQHLSALERDNLITQQLMRTGPTKPALAYSLTPQAEPLFPKQYASLLANLIQELLATEGNPPVATLLSSLGRTAAESYLGRLAHLNSRDKLEEVRRIMEEGGAIAESCQVGPDVVIRDFNCPYSEVVKGQPEVCQVRHSFLQMLLEPATVELACDHRAARCEFRIRPAPLGDVAEPASTRPRELTRSTRNPAPPRR
ncbi:MAG: ArsR family transcriptional regulator [Chloroflexota bacterium]